MKLDRKQKILLTLIIIALLYIAWQLYDLFGRGLFSSSASSVTNPSTTSSQPAKLATTTLPAMPEQSNAASSHHDAAAASLATLPSEKNRANQASASARPLMRVEVQPPKQASKQSNAAISPLTTQQKEYLQLMNQYQMLRLQRQVLGEEAGIARAKEEIAEINRKTKALGGHASSMTSLTTSSLQAGDGYHLLYIDRQNQQWTATISQQGQYYEIAAGDSLPDGAKILAVAQNGVTLLVHDQLYQLSFYGLRKTEKTVVDGKSKVDGSRKSKSQAENLPVTQAPQKPSLPSSNAKQTWQAMQRFIRQDSSVQHKQGDRLAPKPASVKTPKKRMDSATRKLAQKTPLPSKANQGFSIQLIAGYERKTVEQFAHAHPLAHSQIVRLAWRGQPWYVLLFGHYDSFADARAQLLKLPQHLRQHHPWVRSLRGLTQDLTALKS